MQRSMFSAMFPAVRVVPPFILDQRSSNEHEQDVNGDLFDIAGLPQPPNIWLLQGTASLSRAGLAMQYAVSRALAGQLVVFLGSEATVNNGIRCLQLPESSLTGEALERLYFLKVATVQQASRVLVTDPAVAAASCVVVETGDLLETSRERYHVMRLLSLCAAFVAHRESELREERNNTSRHQNNNNNNNAMMNSPRSTFVSCVVAVEPSVTALEVKRPPTQQPHHSLCAQLQGLISGAVVLVTDTDALVCDYESLAISPAIPNQPTSDGSFSVRVKLSIPGFGAGSASAMGSSASLDGGHSTHQHHHHAHHGLTVMTVDVV